MSTELTALNDTVHRTKEALVADLKRIVGDADDLLKQMSNSTSEELVSVHKKLEAKLGDARARLHDARVVVSRQACYAADATNQYISENPWKVVGVASIVGILTALLLARRSFK